jgi:hypothetical protein
LNICRELGELGEILHHRPFDCAQDRPFDCAQDRPFGYAQDRSFGYAQDSSFGYAQDSSFGYAQDSSFGYAQDRRLRFYCSTGYCTPGAGCYKHEGRLRMCPNHVYGWSCTCAAAARFALRPLTMATIIRVTKPRIASHANQSGV